MLTTSTQKSAVVLLILFFVVGFSNKSTAQIVTIPDANFVAFLQDNYPSCITGDQLDTQCPDVLAEDSLNVGYLNIADLTGVVHFVSLTWLVCAHNNVLTTIPSLPAGLIDFHAQGNSLVSLPVLPAGLENITCEYNQLTSLPALPQSLKSLYTGYNNLTVLPALPDSLEFIDCQYNQLTFLPTLPDSINELYCNNNLLQTLPDLPNSMTVFCCVANADLHCLPILPQSLLSTGEYGIGSYYMMQMYGTQITCVPNIPVNIVSCSLPVCSDGDLVNNPNGCIHSSLISGRVYLDSSENCIYDSGEPEGTHAKVFLLDSLGNTVGLVYTMDDGTFNFFDADTGDYTVLLDTINKPYAIQCSYPGIDSSFSIITNDQVVEVDFAMNCQSGPDLGVVTAFTSGIAFPGQLHKVKIRAGDLANYYLPSCASGLGGTVEVTVNGNVNYFGPAYGSITPSSITGNTYTYVIPDFSVIDVHLSFVLLFETMTTAVAGDTVCVDVVVNTGITDLDPSNDSYHYCYAVLNSYDPNIKEVYPTVVEPGYNDWLTYTIHFQNTGNAPAFNIKLKDTLSTLVQPTSFELLANSHNVGVELNGYNATFRFDNIMLPDSASDPEGSIGYVQYRVKPLSNLPEGTEIDNKCYIFFDYNSPIITNTATTSFEVDNSGLTENELNQLTVYPNPTTGAFSFNLPHGISESSTQVLIYNIAGEIVSEYQFSNSGFVTLDLSAEKAGVYFMTVQSGDKVTTCKLIKQ